MSFVNGVNGCDIYIGKGAGKQVLEAIDNAQHSNKWPLQCGFLEPNNDFKY